MSITDQQVFNEIQAQLLETQNSGASYSSGHWTASEVISYANQRQSEFCKLTGILLSRATLPTVPQINRHPLPTNWITTHRVVFQAAPDPQTNIPGEYTEVPRGDGFEADHAAVDWPFNFATDGVPHLYTDGEVPTLQLQVMPATSAIGVLQILYVALPATLTGLGVALTVPDEFVPAIKWGIISDMLGKVGRAQDPVRALWAEAQYQLGVEAAKVMLAGWA